MYFFKTFVVLAATAVMVSATPSMKKRTEAVPDDNCNNTLGDCYQNTLASPTPAAPPERAPRARTTAALARNVVAAMALLAAARTMAATDSRAHAPLGITMAARATKAPSLCRGIDRDRALPSLPDV
ncbi:hypothetical protein V8E55_000352 [Tylopilus felleus]